MHKSSQINIELRCTSPSDMAYLIRARDPFQAPERRSESNTHSLSLPYAGLCASQNIGGTDMVIPES